MEHDPVGAGWKASGSHLQDGIWSVRLDGGGDLRKLEARHLHRTIPDLTVEEEVGTSKVTIKLPRAVLSDGLQSVHLLDRTSGETLASLHIAAGRQVSVDMATELSLLRDELDLLKRSLRTLMSD